MIRLNDIYPTIQGEGACTGMPVALIRLSGCAVGCPWCDTKETWKSLDKHRVAKLADLVEMRRRYSESRGDPPVLPHWCEADEADVADLARSIAPNIHAAMVTGGEPAEQDLAALCTALGERGFLPMLETSGTADGFFDQPWSWICVSPKLDMPGGKPVLEEAVMRANEIKLVVSNRDDLARQSAWVKTRRIRMRPGNVVSLQPESQNPEATRLCVEACIKEGWRLSVQTHKYIGVR